MICLSLKWRVSLWVSTVILAVIATITIVAYNEFQESHFRTIDRILMAMANGIAYDVDNHENTEDLAREIRALTTPPAHNTYSFLYRIWMDGSSADILISDTADAEYVRWLRSLPDQSKTPLDTPVFMNFGPRGREQRAVLVRHKVSGGIVNTVVAGPSHLTFHESQEFLRLMLILGASLILGSIVAVMWTVRCGLLPIDATASQLQHIEHVRPGGTLFDKKKTPQELRPFVQALNDMLERLQGVLHRQKHFTSDAAHELRTPLASAKSTLQAVTMKPRKSEEYVQAIDESLEDIARMEKLTDELLTLARIDEVNGRATTSSKEVEISDLLTELAQAYNVKAGKSGGKVVFEGSPEISLHGDSGQLRRLFGNVIDNAVRYGPAGGTVNITLGRDADNHAIVCIHDEGGAIPAQVIPQLFDRFYRVDSSRSSSTGGVGLGLAIVREIVRSYKGDISIESNTALGTVVRIKLPIN